jgi:hypothetical protein
MHMGSKFAMSSALSSSRSANFNKHLARCTAVKVLHNPDLNAFRAAETAMSISRSSAAWNSATMSSLAGLRIVKSSPVGEPMYYQ